MIERLVEIRERSGFLQAEFAEKMGVSVATQRSYEKGLSKPTTEYLRKMLDAGFDVVYLLTGERRGDVLDAETTALVDAYQRADAATAAAVRRVLGIEEMNK